MVIANSATAASSTQTRVATAPDVSSVGEATGVVTAALTAAFPTRRCVVGGGSDSRVSFAAATNDDAACWGGRGDECSGEIPDQGPNATITPRRAVTTSDRTQRRDEDTRAHLNAASGGGTIRLHGTATG